MNHNIVIATDSTCDLTQELLDKYQIEVLPLYIIINNKQYKDMVELKSKEMYELAEKTNSHPKTATASIQDFYDFFMSFLKEGKEVIYCGIGDKLSSSYQNLPIVKDLVEEKHPEYAEKLHFVDSMNLSTGIALVLIKMCQAREEGKSVEEIIEIGEWAAKHSHSQFCVPNLTYIYKGGRCSNATKFIGNLLSIKPMLKVVDGKLQVWKKSIGSYKKALNIMIEEFLSLFDHIDRDVVFITHSIGDQYATYIRNKIQEVTPEIKNLYETYAGCVISSHCGQGTIGILYILNDDAPKKKTKKRKQQENK